MCILIHILIGIVFPILIYINGKHEKTNKLSDFN